MHEISLVRNIFKTLESEFTAEELGRLESINLKVGQLSNVEPTLMQSAFDAVRNADAIYPDVKLLVESVPIEISCKNCGERSRIEQYRFVCQFCGTPSNNIVQGTELLIHQVEFRDI